MRLNTRSNDAEAQGIPADEEIGQEGKGGGQQSTYARLQLDVTLIIPQGA